jgi:epoxyqueuosine reductase
MLPLSTLSAEARALGFAVLGAAPASPLEREAEALEAWLRDGMAGGLSYMARRPRDRADPRALCPGARTIVSLAVPHAVEAPPFGADARYGRVARYAWGLDYHRVVPPRLEALVGRLASVLGRPVRARSATDEAPLLERGFAARAGLGFVGKNTCLLVPRGGSWWLLAELLLDVEVEPSGPPPDLSCGACRNCLNDCPTGAFPAPYRLDARRCISFLTIENRGPIPRELRPSIGPWAFGCDVCQEACPFNRSGAPDPWPEFAAAAGVGPRIDLVEVLAIDDDEVFRARYRRTPLRHAKRAGLCRNAAVVARNVGAAVAVPRLLRRVERDREGLVRGHALWALAGLAPGRARPLADRLRTADPDPFVRAEALATLA